MSPPYTQIPLITPLEKLRKSCITTNGNAGSTQRCRRKPLCNNSQTLTDEHTALVRDLIFARHDLSAQERSAKEARLAQLSSCNACQRDIDNVRAKLRQQLDEHMGELSPDSIPEETKETGRGRGGGGDAGHQAQGQSKKQRSKTRVPARPSSVNQAAPPTIDDDSSSTDSCSTDDDEPVIGIGSIPKAQPITPRAHSSKAGKNGLPTPSSSRKAPLPARERNHAAVGPSVPRLRGGVTLEEIPPEELAIFNMKSLRRSNADDTPNVDPSVARRRLGGVNHMPDVGQQDGERKRDDRKASSRSSGTFFAGWMFWLLVAVLCLIVLCLMVLLVVGWRRIREIFWYEVCALYYE